MSGLSIEYVLNPRYQTTNNIYSLWLAREVLDEPFVLIECDLVFDAALLDDMVFPDTIAVSPVRPWMVGTKVAMDADDQVLSFRVGADAADAPKDFHHKTVNIYSLSLPTWRCMKERLDRKIAQGIVNDYYETVFAEMTADRDLDFRAVVFDPRRWYEIDTIADLRAAERLLAPKRWSVVTPPLPQIAKDRTLLPWPA